MSDSISRSLRTVCGHDSRSVDGCLNCEAADLIESLRLDDNWRRQAVDELRECHLKIATLSPEASGADYVMVPRKATLHMLDSGRMMAPARWGEGSAFDRNDAEELWDSMLAAAPINPAPPTSGPTMLDSFAAKAAEPRAAAQDSPRDVSWWVRRLKEQEAITDRFKAELDRLQPSGAGEDAARLAVIDGPEGAEFPDLDWPADGRFTVNDERGEHDPCWLVMPGGEMLAFRHHAINGVDQARAKFIADACNAAIDAARWARGESQ